MGNNLLVYVFVIITILNSVMLVVQSKQNETTLEILQKNNCLDMVRSRNIRYPTNPPPQADWIIEACLEVDIPEIMWD